MPRYRSLVLGLFVLLAVGWLAAPAATALAEEAKPAAKTADAKTDKKTEEKKEAAAPAPPAPAKQVDLDALWTVLAAILVFFMQAGFAMVETGFTRAKNACNILMKNLMDFSIGTLIFWVIGFGLMFGVSDGYFGTTAFLFDGKAEAAVAGKTESMSWAFLIFQTVFCATAATIVSGAMAERTKFSSYLVYSAVITALVYPIFGKWAWGSLFYGDGAKGWLEKLEVPFHDFAGSTVVHSVGGWCALAGAIVLGARIGKYRDGKTMPIPGHNIPLAALGVFILWLGWFGFNPGSTTAIGSDGASFAYIAITTNLAAATGALTAMIASWVKFKKPDPSFMLNGALAGLVAITAGCDYLTPMMAVVTGGVAGVIVVFAVLLFDKLRIDDPVGAVSVHGVCGLWGTIAVGLFPALGFELYAGAKASLMSQLIGVGTAFAWAFPVSFAVFSIIKVTIGLRVSEQEEMDGLDIHEHGMLAYPAGFVSELQTGSPVAGVPVSAYGTSPAPAAKPVPAGQS